ncbi:MAG TPA: hypothetical protein VF641_10280 [Methylobacterium sp.]
MKHFLIAALLAASLTTPVGAEPEIDARPPDSKAERQKNNAAKLAGLVGFVRSSCPEARADDERLKAVVLRLGVDPADLEQGDLALRAKAYAEIYAKDVPANCARAIENFGETGTTMRGLIGKN